MATNTELWDAVSTTDPSHTKKVSQRGGFTAIDAHYQVMNATKQFGAVGIGWGYDTVYKVVGEMIMCELVFWHGNREQRFGPICGCSVLTGSRNDTDAPKKAMTDALTKALSHLGFNADVFMGKFDDNKYLEDVALKFSPAGVEYDQLCAMNAGTIQAIKEGILKGELSSAKEAWNELDDTTKEAIWKAPSKGGCFTTEERAAFRLPEWKEAQ